MCTSQPVTMAPRRRLRESPSEQAGASYDLQPPRPPRGERARRIDAHHAMPACLAILSKTRTISPI